MGILWVGLIGHKGTLLDTPQLPMPLGCLKRCWRDSEARWFVFVLFFINFGEFFLGSCCRGDGQIWRDWEMRGIEVHDAKVPKNQLRIM